MSLKDWFAAKRSQSQKKLDANGINRVPDEEMSRLWTKCFKCSENLPTKALQANLSVCMKCGYHFRIGSRERIAQLAERFLELNEGLAPADPLEFEDTEKYTKRQADARRKSGLNDAVVTGIAEIDGEAVALAIMDFGYMGGSMGSVVGEKITRLIERALEDRLSVIIFASSGGARMQEGTFSLMQMVKTGAALSRLHEAGLLYIAVLTEPTFGGVTASFGTLGDIIIAEEGARIGFAGRRVIEQTIRQKLPPDFQTANYLLRFGQLDMVVSRPEMKATLARLVRLHRVSSGQQPSEGALANAEPVSAEPTLASAGS